MPTKKSSNVLHPELNAIVFPIWCKFVELFPELINFEMPRVRFNNRLTVTGGLCYDSINLIELSTVLFREFREDYIKFLIPHEIAHQVDFNLTGAKHAGHGETWQQIMGAYGIPPDVYHDLFEQRDYKNFLKGV